MKKCKVCGAKLRAHTGYLTVSDKYTRRDQVYMCENCWNKFLKAVENTSVKDMFEITAEVKKK